ncbi:ECF transporter S component [candidate division KSB1 bacterium]|nr:ECF transporter S component [candidate division KSB1 bacterium]
MGTSKKALFIARLSILIAFTLMLQAAALPQPITGPLVNTMLFFTAAYLGTFAGVVLGIITPLIALLMGQLPAALALMVPFIILANASLVIIFTLGQAIDLPVRWFTRSQIYIAILLAAAVKTFILFITVKLIVPLAFGRTFPDNLVLMMTTPQFVTALIGGIISLFLVQVLKKSHMWNT